MRRFKLSHKLPYLRFHSTTDDEGYQWKIRDLQEKRELALKYMADIKLRVPIHDSIRQKILLNRRASRTYDPMEVRSILESNSKPPCDSSFNSLHRSLLDAIDECADLNPEFLCPTDRTLLDNEFVGGSPEAKLDDTMRDWLDLRRRSSDYQTFSSIPEGERSSWSAWYLRGVKSPPHD